MRVTLTPAAERTLFDNRGVAVAGTTTSRPGSHPRAVGRCRSRPAWLPARSVRQRSVELVLCSVSSHPPDRDLEMTHLEAGNRPDACAVEHFSHGKRTCTTRFAPLTP